MTTIIIYRFFVNVQIHNIFHKLIQFHLCKFYAKKKQVLVVLESVKFQFTIISLVNFCNYSLFFFKFKIYVRYKRYLTNLKQNKYLFVIQVKRVVISGSFRVDTNKLAYQMCLLRVMQVDPFMTQTH